MVLTGIVFFFSSTIPWFCRESCSFSLPRFLGFARNRLLLLSLLFSCDFWGSVWRPRYTWSLGKTLYSSKYLSKT
jgi:hypothetical protein